MSKFQIILLAIFAVFIIAGVATFSLYRGSGGKNVAMTVWGDISSQDFSLLLSTPTLSQDRTLSISYVEKSAETIETEFTEALARGMGPDLIILTQDKLWGNKAKLLVIPYVSISERDFKTTFIEEGELFLDEAGIHALPLSIDPMVLYYNRDLLSATGQARPIAYWDEIYASAANLSKMDAAGNLVLSVMALGEATNIPHAKDILSLLLLQAGTPITNFVNLELRSQISLNFGTPVSPGEAALDFYTQFSNPTRVYYSWNRSLIDAQTHFTSGDSAYYLGFASELRVLRNKNPTLNFGISSVPQSRISGKAVTFGRLRAIAISRGSLNPGAALVLATKLVSKEAALSFSEILILPPARRDLLSLKPTDAISSVFYDAALQSKGWLDPDTVATEAIFREAIESVTSGRARTVEAINRANREIEALIKR
ncbi:MAG: extracellular solute-binding protein [Patescibacteria group bacterium]|nr:extracellular solute-binding protein [Patescibacteria group bacterium]